MTAFREQLMNQAIRNFGMEDKFTIAFFRVAEGSVASDRMLEQILAMHADKIKREAE